MPSAKTGQEAAAEPQQEQQPDKVVVKGAPPWLVSLVVHMVMLLIMALIVQHMNREEPAVIITSPPPIYAEELGEQLLDDSVPLSLKTNDIAKEAILTPQDLPPVPDPLAAPPDVKLADAPGQTATSDIKAPAIGLALKGRQAGSRQVLLGAYGGNATTEAAVGKALMWLKSKQWADGGWSLAGAGAKPFPDGAGTENRVSATAMALLAFQGHGDTPKAGTHAAVVANGWKWLLSKQDKDGRFLSDDTNNHNAAMYTHAQASIAICELYGMTRDEKYRKPAQLAVDFCLKAQDQNLGGWRYEVGNGSDTSVTGWFLMALQSARMAGLDVPSGRLELINKFLDKVQHNEGSEYSYLIGQSPKVTMTAEALLCREYLGWKPDDKRLIAGINILLENPIDWSDANTYYWYYATQTIHHFEGDAWKQWNKVMSQAIPKQQVAAGPEGGSWAPGTDRWGAIGGRLYQTCLCTYMLEIYYRHMPLYSDKVKLSAGE